VAFFTYIAPLIVHRDAEAGHVIANPADCTGYFGRVVCFQAYDWNIKEQLFIRDIDQLDPSDSAAVRNALAAAETDWNSLGVGPQRFAILPNVGDVYNWLKPASLQETGGNIALTRRCGIVAGTPNVCISDLAGPAVNAEWTEVLTLVDPGNGVAFCFPCQPYSGQKRLVLHEWGHVMGLRHHGNCTDLVPTLMCEGPPASTGQVLGGTEAEALSDCKTGGTSTDDGVRCIYNWYNCSDSDCDNLTGSADNCPSAPNQTQRDADSERLSLSPYYSDYDATNVVAYDRTGDVCDDDDDGDELSTAQELLFVSCPPVSTAATDPLNDDTDGDGIIDGVECLVGSGPANAASVPATSPDGDNDGLQDGLEYLVWGSSPFDADSDDDFINDGAEALRYRSDPNRANSDSAGDVVLCGDRREAASVDPDTSVTASDLGRVGSKFGTYSRFDHAKRRLDFNRDGNITAADLGQLASAFGSCP